MTMPTAPELGLGTVQFGLDYGISNQHGRPSSDEVAAILTLASDKGMRLLDTAAAYGSSEEVLGACPAAEPFRIVTKAGPFGAQAGAVERGRATEEMFRRSLSRLGRSSIDGLLVHSADDLLGEGGEEIHAAMQGLKAAGLVEKIGSSVYSPGQVEALLERFEIDLVQAPFNVFDQRLERQGTLARLKERGIEVHARSAFLQGLLLMQPEELGEYFAPARPALEAFRAAAAEAGLSPFEACLQFAMRPSGVDVVLCGVNRRRELEEILAAIAKPATGGLDFAALAFDDTRFIHPQNWPRR